MGERITEEQRERKRAQNRRLYHSPASSRKSTILANNKRAIQRNIEMQRKIKSERGCAECGEQDPVVLQFHHRDPSQKKFNVAQPGTSSEARLLAEIEKCDVLCASCHLRHHAREKASARCA